MTINSRALLAAAMLLAAASGLQAQEQDVAARVAAARSRLDAIAVRARARRRHQRIENLQRSYGYYLDKMLWDEVVDLFTADGTMEIGPAASMSAKPASAAISTA
jgi:hypothetical protein